MNELKLEGLMVCGCGRDESRRGGILDKRKCTGKKGSEKSSRWVRE